MTTRTKLLVGAAGGVLIAFSGATLAEAKTARHTTHRTHVRHRTRVRTTSAPNNALLEEVRALREQVQAMQGRIDAQGAAQQQVQAQLQSVPAQAAAEAQAQSQAQLEDLQTTLGDVQQAQAIQTATINANKPVVNVTLPNGRPTFASVDGKFTANIHGIGQFDAGAYFQNDKRKLPNPPYDQRTRDLNSGTNFRRARIGFEGKVFGDFDYSFLYEFGGSGAEDAGHIHEIWFQYSGFKPFHFRIGAFEPLIGMNANISTNSIPFLERAAPAEVSRNVAAGDSRSALQIFGNDDFDYGLGGPGSKTHWLASVALSGNTVSTLNSTGGFASQPFGEQVGYLGRLAIAPYGPNWTLHFGVHGQHVVHPNDTTGSQSTVLPAIPAAGRYTVTLQDRPELRLDTTRLVSTGALNASTLTEYGVELGGQWKSFFAQGEYFRYDVSGNSAALSNPRFSGWYGEGSYFLTGETRVYAPGNGAFSGVTPKHNFSWADRTWGAFELATRYSDLDLNFREGSRGLATPIGGVRGGEQKIISVALDWYLNPTIRFVLQGQEVRIERLNGAGINIGQEFQTVEVRSQVAF